MHMTVFIQFISNTDLMLESIPGVTPPEHTREFDLIDYDTANARVQGHN
jgi:hypothetical protein